MFRQVDTLLTCSKAQWGETSAASASLGESEDPLASMSSTAACMMPTATAGATAAAAAGREP